MKQLDPKPSNAQLEIDRLYGELCKLSELAQRPISPELLDERMSQAQTVQSLKAWKVLVK